MKSPLLVELPMPIRTSRLLLRIPAAGDGACVHEAIQESLPELRRWLSWARAFDGNPATTEETMRKFHIDALLRKEIPLLIFSNDTLIGVCGLHNIVWSIPCCTIGYWIRTSAIHQGYATEAVSALSLYAIQQLGMRRLVILCDEENSKSAAVAERLQFALEVKAKNLMAPKEGEENPRLGRVYVRFDVEGLPDVGATWG